MLTVLVTVVTGTEGTSICRGHLDPVALSGEFISLWCEVRISTSAESVAAMTL